MVKVTSSNLAFIDTTDSRKFEVHISSNLPQSQLYDRNTAVYTPDWSDTALNLQASIYLDSTDITENINDSDVEWYKNTISTATKISNGKTLTINTNVLSTEPIITYICQAKYQNLTTGTRIDYTRVDSGINGMDGTDGVSAPAVQAQYSVDGSAWTATLNAAAHKYVRYSYDGGETWTTAIKMAGEDGTSVVIKGTATSVTPVEGTNYYTIVYDSTAITAAELGDAYLYNGDLYVCANSKDGEDYFINAGKIQGPAGNDGISSYLFIRYAIDANGNEMSPSPSGKTYIGVYTSNTNVAPITASSYKWSKFVGDSAKSIILSGDSQVFKVSKSSAYTPTIIKVTAETINISSEITWSYNINDGEGFVSTAPTGVTRLGNTVTITGTTLTANSVTIKASDGTVEDVFTVYKAFDGVDGVQGAAGQSASMAFLTNENVTLSADSNGVVAGGKYFTTNVVAYNGTTKDNLVLDNIGTITGVPKGITVTKTASNNEVAITFTIDAPGSDLGSSESNYGEITIPINSTSVNTSLKLNWSKVNSGATGTAASLVDITPSALYFKSTTGKDGTFTPEYIYLYPRFQTVTYVGWQYSTDGGATWNMISGANGLLVVNHNSTPNTLRISRTSTLYTDTITSISFKCLSSDTAVYDTVSITKIYDVVDLVIGGRNYILDTEAEWATTRLSANSAYDIYKNNLNSVFEQLVGEELMISFEAKIETLDDANGQIRVYGTNGNPKYQLGGINFTNIPPNQWQRFEAPARITYNENNTGEGRIEFYGNNATTTKIYIRKFKLEKGNKATDWTPAPEDLLNSASNINVMLSNEAHFFEADYNGIPTATSVTLSVIGFKGATQSVTTVGAIGGLPSAGMTTTISNNGTTNTTITVAVTTALTSAIANYGTLTIPITVNGKTINKVFSWSKAKAGTPGDGAHLVTITPSALYFKSTKGKNGTFTPAYIYLYPRFQNTSYQSWQYSTDGGITWLTTMGADGISVIARDGISNVLRIARSSNIYTDDITSISFRCNTNDVAVYDTVSIAKIYDVVDLDIGGRNLLYDSTFNTGTVWTKVYGTILAPEADKPNSSIYHVAYTNSGTAAVGSPIYNSERTYISLKAGDSITVSYDFYTDSLDLVGDQITTLRISTAATGGTITALYSNSKPHLVNAGLIAGKWQRFNYTYTATTDLEGWLMFGMYIRAEVGATVSYKFREVKVERGNKATDWTPAPEDTDANIERVDTRLTSSLAEVKTTTDSITSRVSSTEESIKTVNGNVTSLTTRVSSAEEKITDDAIVSTVRQSTDYINDLGQKVGTNEIISKINQTAESITISANKIGLLGATSIPDLTADKIKGGTLTLGGSSATTQNGQLLVKNASDVDMVKLNKDGVVVKSGHLAVAEDFENSRYNWEDDSWTTTTNTSQLDLSDDYLRMGVYSPSGYTPYMVLSDQSLNFQGVAQGIGSWGSFIGHDSGDFVIQDTVRSNISFRGYGDAEMANISGEGLYVNGPISGGTTSGTAKLFSNVFVKNFNSQPTGYICVKLGNATLASSSMITVKGHVTSYGNSTSFEASCYFYNSTGTFFGTVATMTNPDVLREVYFAEGATDGNAYLILGTSNLSWSYPTVAIDSLSVGYAGTDSYVWANGWDAVVYSNLTSNFTKLAACSRGGMKTTLWSGAINAGKTITLHENLRNFKFLTCIIGDSTTPYGIVLPSMLDDEITELHFFGFVTNSYAASEHYGAKFVINNQTSLTLAACGTSANNTLYCRKIVGWR